MGGLSRALPMLVLVIASAYFKGYDKVMEIISAAHCHAVSGYLILLYKSTLWHLKPKGQTPFCEWGPFGLCSSLP